VLHRRAYGTPVTAHTAYGARSHLAPMVLDSCAYGTQSVVLAAH